MLRHLSVAILTAAGSSTLGVAQDLKLEVVGEFDISELCVAGAPVYVGKNPVSIAWDGSSLFVGGYESTGLGATMQIAEIQNLLDGEGLWTVREVGGSSAAFPALRGRPGLDWDDDLGLLATLDLGTNNAPGQVQIFTRATPTDPLSLAQSSASGSGVAGPSWDYGPGGTGFARSDQTTGPIAGVMDFRERDPIGLLGPLGLDPFDLSQTYFVQQDDTSSIVFGGGGPDISLNGTADTLWRDVDFHPDGGIAARVTQDLVIAERSAGNLQSSVIKVSDATDEALLWGNNAAWVYSVPCLPVDVVVWNDRGPRCLGTLTDAVRITDRDGVALTYSVVDALDAEFTAWARDICVYDFAWDAAAGQLFVVEFNSKKVYVLQPVCAVACPVDLNGDGIADNGDISAFLGLFLGGDLAADFNGDGILDNGDIGSFVMAFLVGC
jgi:hypothetical protein